MSDTKPTYAPKGWIADQPADKVAELIAHLDEKGIHSDIPDPYFRAWFYLVDLRMIRRFGLGANDIEDWCSADSYESGDSPAEGMSLALESSDTYQSIFG